MKTTNNRKWPLVVISIYILCFVIRMIEYMLIRTDRSIIGEAFIHKMAGIFILIAALRIFHYRSRDIGFQTKHAGRGILYGLLLGSISFIIAYGSEFLIQSSKSSDPQFIFFVSSYSITGNDVMESGGIFFLICFLGNIINVIMEEGIFRGLFIRLAESRVSFLRAMLFSSLLFGIWHIAAPLREYLDGTMSFQIAAAAALIQIIFTALMSIQLCLLVKITGSLWMPMAVHFFNNFIVNILHVVTISSMDEMQVVRISIAQTISFIIVLFIFIRQKANRKPTFRAD